MTTNYPMTKKMMYFKVLAWAIIGIAILIALWITPAVLAWWERLVT